MENKEVMRRKHENLHYTEWEGNYERASEVNNELKVNVDEQQDDIKYVKEQCDFDKDNEVQEITAAITPMKKKKPVCVTCN